MNIDIQTEHVLMRPEWHRMIDEWMERCARYHPDVVGVDLTLRHGAGGRQPEEVDVVATALGRRLRAARQAEIMTLALHAALGDLEGELLVHEAVRHRADGSGPSTAP